MTPRPVAGLIPHSGSMCLLDQVIECTDTSVRCTAESHRNPANPLRADGRLPATAAIEYAAQAMAAHGALLAAGGTGPAARSGMLASARDVRLGVARLDDLAAPLDVRADALSREASSLLYEFTVSAGAQPVASGRLVVVLR